MLNDILAVTVVQRHYMDDFNLQKAKRDGADVNGRCQSLVPSWKR